jgi:hypothetical protein
MHLIWLIKHARVGVRLFTDALKVIVFDHRSYWLLCFIIAITQMLHFTWLAYSDVTFSFNKFVKAFFEGQDILDELQELFTTSLAIDQFKIVATKTFILFATSLILMAIHVATAHSILFNESQYKSLLSSLTKIPMIISWALVETFVFLTVATRGYVGAVIFVFWQLATSFVIPMIADTPEGLLHLIKKSWVILKKKVSDIIGGDFISEMTFLVLGACIAAFESPGTLPEAPRIYQFSFLKVLITFGIIYLASIVVVAQTIFFTIIYEETK